MISDNMAFLYHSCNDLGSGFQLIGGAKERSLYLLLLKSIENFLRVAVIVAAVKGQIEYLALRLGVISHGLEIFTLKKFFRVNGDLMRLSVLVDTV